MEENIRYFFQSNFERFDRINGIKHVYSDQFIKSNILHFSSPVAVYIFDTGST